VPLAYLITRFGFQLPAAPGRYLDELLFLMSLRPSKTSKQPVLANHLALVVGFL
jgi:hypothetical protein